MLKSFFDWSIMILDEFPWLLVIYPFLLVTLWDERFLYDLPLNFPCVLIKILLISGDVPATVLLIRITLKSLLSIFKSFVLPSVTYSTHVSVGISCNTDGSSGFYWV